MSRSPLVYAVNFLSMCETYFLVPEYAAVLRHVESRGPETWHRDEMRG